MEADRRAHKYFARRYCSVGFFTDRSTVILVSEPAPNALDYGPRWRHVRAAVDRRGGSYTNRHLSRLRVTTDCFTSILLS